MDRGVGLTCPRLRDPFTLLYKINRSITPVEGRWFTEADGPGRPLVMLVNQEFADRYFDNRSPVGESVVSVGGPDARWEIIGVVDNVRQTGLDTAPEPEFFLEFRQMMGRSPDLLREQAPGMAYFAVRTAREPEALVGAVRGVLSELNDHASMTDVGTLDQVITDSIADSRFNAVLTGVFAGVAVALASIGVFGIVSYTVTRRTREIGIRIALGAESTAVLSLVMRKGLGIAAGGIVLGLAGTVAVTRFLSSLLFELTPLDARTLMLAAALFTALTAIACYIPARKAVSVAPLTALRHD